MNLLRELDQDDRIMSGAILTTFPFAPQFFERTVLPALREKNADDNIAVLVDDTHYDATLDGDDQGTTALGHQQFPGIVGQGYHLAPVAAGPQRAFHPKVHYLAGERRVQAVVTSANLTHPGLTSNQEIATRVTVAAPDDAGDVPETSDDTELVYRTKAALCRDVAAFIETLADSSFGRSVDPVTRATIDRVVEAGDWIDGIAEPQNPTAWLVDSLDQPILTQVRERIATRGETIQSVDVTAPFYGQSLAVPQQFTDNGIETRLWLQQERTQIPVAELERWLDAPEATAMDYEMNRYVHGKVLRIRTDAAVYVLSGSPNASRAALLTAATNGGNIEAAVCRRHSNPDQFTYLFDTDPFQSATSIDMTTFEPGKMTVPDADTAAESVPDNSFELYGVSYRRKDSYDGGTLVVTGCADSTVRTAIEQDGFTLEVTPPGRRDRTEPTTEQFESHAIEWDETQTPPSFTATMELFGKAADRPLSRPATGHLQCGEYESDSRWVQTQSPKTGEPTAADVEDAGATAVPRTLTRLYQDSEQATAIESLNGLLAALRSVETGDEPDTEPDDERAGPDGPRGGLHVREWTGTGSDDPSDLLASFFDGWEDDLEAAYSCASEETPYLEMVETRLKAINATTLQLLVLDQAQPNVRVPKQLALNTIKDVYSRQDIDDHLESLLADYCAVCRLYAAKSDTDDEIYTGLREQILPQILLAAIIAEAHVAGDQATYFQQQDWAFEQLANECFPDRYPTSEALTPARIDTLVTTIWESIAGIRDRIEGSRQLHRHADDRYLNRDQLRWTVFELLGRCLLVAGEGRSEQPETTPQQAEELERIFDTYREYLPS